MRQLNYFLDNTQPWVDKENTHENCCENFHLQLMLKYLKVLDTSHGKAASTNQLWWLFENSCGKRGKFIFLFYSDLIQTVVLFVCQVKQSNWTQLLKRFHVVDLPTETIPFSVLNWLDYESFHKFKNFNFTIIIIVIIIIIFVIIIVAFWSVSLSE